MSNSENLKIISIAKKHQNRSKMHKNVYKFLII